MNNENRELEVEHSEAEPVSQESDTHDRTIDAGPQAATQAETNDSIEVLQEKLAEAEKRALLYQADLENFRRRKSRETQDALKYASLPLINGLLQVLDNLDRALESSAQESADSSLREGVELVRTQLLSTLEGHGCQQVVALGKVFDPNLHEAIQMQPDPHPANTVIMELQPGFLLFDRVVRPAKVIISTGPAGAS